jgi:hypothetical protein
VTLTYNLHQVGAADLAAVDLSNETAFARALQSKLKDEKWHAAGAKLGFTRSWSTSTQLVRPLFSNSARMCPINHVVHTVTAAAGLQCRLGRYGAWWEQLHHDVCASVTCCSCMHRYTQAAVERVTVVALTLTKKFILLLMMMIPHGVALQTARCHPAWSHLH